jgi:hypothetical protein
MNQLVAVQWSTLSTSALPIILTMFIGSGHAQQMCLGARTQTTPAAFVWLARSDPGSRARDVAVYESWVRPTHAALVVAPCLGATHRLTGLTDVMLPWC